MSESSGLYFTLRFAKVAGSLKNRQLIALKCLVSLCKSPAVRLEFARHPDANPRAICSFYCHFKNSSPVIALFNSTPAIHPVDIAYDTAR